MRTMKVPAVFRFTHLSNAVVALLCLALPLTSPAVVADEAALDFFEREIRPLLVEKCSRCLGNEEQSGGLRVDLRPALLAGGDSATAAVVPGDVAQSLLIQAVRRDGELEMPPDEPLRPSEIEALERWIEMGAPWPETSRPISISRTDAAQVHRAFQPMREPAIPQVQAAGWVRTPVDAFVLANLEKHELAPASAAVRRTLIRRLTYSLTGLPPTAEDVERFVHDAAPDAYEALVERLLASTKCGEQWARHWLDVARY